MEKFYITTPIYYPSNKLTLGNCYTTVVCDAMARFNRMLGKEVYYLTGTDEHGQKIQRKAIEAGKTEMEFLDEIIADTKNLWQILDISYDDFIRTTDKKHIECVKKVVEKLFEQGDIYEGSYEGLYCTPCESFWMESQLVDGKCPDCGREVENGKEEAYFFRLSKYESQVKELFNEDSRFLEPKSRVNEMTNSFLKNGLKDICISRSSVNWGIKAPFNHKHTIYVWIDALLNYISALGYLSDDDSLFKIFWPADIHVVGKEIVRFHSLIWPALLLALNLPLPKKIFAHGWIIFGEDKLSKSKETTIKDITDPRILASRYGADAVRFFLTKEIPFGSDGNYSQELFLESINNHLSNNIGNLVSRTISMIEKYFNGFIPRHYQDTELDLGFKNDIIDYINESIISMDELRPTDSINSVLKIFSRANKYIDETEPWNLAKLESNERLATVLYNLTETILKGSTLLLPFLTKKPLEIFASFNVSVPIDFLDIRVFNLLCSGIKVKKGDNLFPRLDLEKENEELSKLK